MSALRVLLLYAWFDVTEDLTWRTAVLSLGLPVAMLVFGFFLVGPLRSAGPALVAEEVLIVTPDPALVERALPSAAFLEPHHVTVRDRRPDDVSGFDVVAEIDLRPEAPEPVRVQDLPLGPTVPWRASFRAWVAEWWLVGQGAAPLVVAVEGAAAPDDASTDLVARYGVGLVNFVLLGLLVGFAVGPRIAESGRQGFLLVTGLAAPRVVLYVAEMVSGVVKIGLMSSGMWLLYAAWSLRQGATALPLDLALAAVLGVSVVCQSVSAGCVGAQVARDVPLAIRPYLGSVLFFAGYPLARAISRGGVDPDTLRALAALPLVGPMATWSLGLQDLGALAGLAALQVAYAAAAIWLGSRSFLLDESPLTHLRRRFGRGAA